MNALRSSWQKLRLSSIALALVLLFCAAFMKPLTLTQSVFTLQVSLDISQSMDVEDVSTGSTTLSRLAFSKTIATHLLESLPCGSRIGWSVFTGRRTLTLLTPLEVCEHYSALISSLNEIDGSMRWSNGSGIGKALHQSMRAADSMETTPDIVFITDGHEAPPLETGQRGMPSTDKFKVSGLIVGVGSEQPSPIPKTNPSGERAGYWQAADVVQLASPASGISHEELSKRHDEHLRNLARLAKLDYTPFNDTRGFIQDTMKASQPQSLPAPTDLRWIPAMLALLTLLWRFSPQLYTVWRRH